jgi:membrane fusion protein (multidrug efflux system)
MSSNPDNVVPSPATAATPAAPATNGNGNGKRKLILTSMVGVFVLLLIAYGIWYFLVGSHFESTDDAYVAGNVVQVTPQVTGTVVAIKADDTDTVKAGQDLILLDQADAQVALDQAEAQLAQTVREVRTLYANNGTLSANIAARAADVVRARSALVKAQDDYQRRASLVAGGAVSKEELQHVQADLDAARSSLAAADAAANAAREQLSSNQALTDGTHIDQHPNVLRAAAQVKAAYLALQRGAILAPVTGQVAKRSVQVGQRVQPGTALMAIVPLDHLWVDANFKEVQLRKMRIGQPVTLEADVYGSKVEYQGKVLGLSAGTGSAFSLLPAQNATGNWIKVVQRVPVRIELDAKDLAEHPLRVGLSVVAKVDTSVQDGARITSATAPSAAAYQTQAYASQDQGAGQIVKQIIAANLGKG